MKIPKIDYTHLLITVFVTFIIVIPTFIILLLLSSMYDKYYVNDWIFSLELFILEFLIYTVALAILLKKDYKYKLIYPEKAFSFKIASILLTFLFCWYVRFPVNDLLTLNPSEKTGEEKGEDFKKTIENYVKENNITDSITTKQIDNLIDTLGPGWKKVDTIINNNKL